MTWTTRPRSEIGGHPAIRAGRGPDVLLLHGVGLRAEAWGAQIDALAARFTVTAPDMPGHGESPWHGRPLPLADYIAAARDVLLALDGPALVVGHSMGAMLALALAAADPDRVRAVAALNAVFERDAQASAAVATRADALDGATRADPTGTLRRWFGDNESAERDACARWLREVDPAAYGSAYTAFAHATIPDRAMLGRIGCPALFVTGAEEPNSTPVMSRAMAEIAPQGRALIVPGAAHMLPMTHPGPVNAALVALAEMD